MVTSQGVPPDVLAFSADDPDCTARYPDAGIDTRHQERVAAPAVPAAQVRGYPDPMTHGNTPRKLYAAPTEKRVLGEKDCCMAEKNPYPFCSEPCRVLFSYLEPLSHSLITVPQLRFYQDDYIR